MTGSLRTNDVSTTDANAGNGDLAQFACWFNLAVPGGFDEAAGDYLTFTFNLTTGAGGDYPDSFAVYVDFIPMQLDGGALNAGPYVASGYSYTVGRQFAYYGTMHASSTTPGAFVLDHDSPGETEFALNEYVANVTAGGGGFAGQGVIVNGGITEVAGWNALINFRQTANTALPLVAGTTFTLLCYLQVFPSDLGNPARTMFLELQSGSMTYVPFVGSPVTTTIDLSAAKVGFNTGAAAAPGRLGPYVYRSLRTVELAKPPASSLFQDMHLVARRRATVGRSVRTVYL